MTCSWLLPFLCVTKRSSLTTMGTEDRHRLHSEKTLHERRMEKSLEKDVDEEKKRHSTEEEEMMKKKKKKEWS